jgi:hypothetical protein
MGTIALTLLTSLDGVMQSPGSTDVPFKYRGWTLDFDLGPEGDRFKLEEAQYAEASCSAGSPTRPCMPSGPQRKVSTPTG